MSLLNVINENDNDLRVNCERPAFIRGLDGRDVTVIKVAAVEGQSELQMVSPELYSYQDALDDAAEGMLKLQYDNEEYQLESYSESSIIFRNTSESTIKRIRWNHSPYRDWIFVALPLALEKTTNKVNHIFSDSTNEQYPSAKAVYNLVTTYPGTVGPQGPQGPQGPAGPAGESALPFFMTYHITDQNTFAGYFDEDFADAQTAYASGNRIYISVYGMGVESEAYMISQYSIEWAFHVYSGGSYVLVVARLDNEDHVTVDITDLGSAPPEVHIGTSAPTGEELLWVKTDDDDEPDDVATKAYVDAAIAAAIGNAIEEEY